VEVMLSLLLKEEEGEPLIIEALLHLEAKD
jgi:hypothetical protein